MADDEVGSLGRELADLFRTMSAANAQEGEQTATGDKAHEPANCPHSWCPVCRVAETVRDHPELLDHVLEAATAFARSVRDLMETVPHGADEATTNDARSADR